MTPNTPHPASAPSLSIEGRLATLTLRRPRAINAIGPADVDILTELLAAAVAEPAVGTILVRGEGDRGFCAGGDIKEVRGMIVADDLDRLAAFWSVEYRLDHLIATCPKDIVSVAHGLTLGGGMGLASHASHRVVTDSTRLGMPEVLIGLSPDAGGLWLFSHAPGSSGTFAALTAAELDAGDALYMGLADHYVPEAKLDGLMDRLLTMPASAALEEFTGSPPSRVAEHQSIIDKVFGAPSVAEIAERAAGAEIDLRAEVLAAASPTALTVTHEALRRAADMGDLAECLEQDLVVGQHCARHPDLEEGIRARVVDKDRAPRWQPPTLADVADADVAAFFHPTGTPLQLTGW
ncbi:enoyl-CoA hydratase/isomerase family protein [Mycolicibacterium mengxianglii]|uniref:enoyl-CoA hydratase/isomerase family protein n=1 Tax=Mycolicibacterium mengxianglii TaxID=2736649 RepID=UPI0018D1C282|nr:enoyl-CoA hydratase/isomerase family protein [Mycolicibacterium mengxianglii]